MSPGLAAQDFEQRVPCFKSETRGTNSTGFVQFYLA